MMGRNELRQNSVKAIQSIKETFSPQDSRSPRSGCVCASAPASDGSEPSPDSAG